MNRNQTIPSTPGSTPESSKLFGTIQVHIDSTWAIAKTFGVSAPPKNYVYQYVVPQIIDLFNRYRIKATFFVIGKDLEDEKNREVVSEIYNQGHEIGNHSFTHPIGFRYLTRSEKEMEVQITEKLIEEVTGSRPRGFATPAYDIDEETLQILEERDYLYDTSVFPSHFSFWAKTYRHLRTIFEHTAGSSPVKPSSWGRLSYMFAPRRPYHPKQNRIWQRGSSPILEIPISTIPILGMPFYNYFCLFSGERYFKVGLHLLSRFKREINYLIHPTELLDPASVKKYGADLIDIPTLNIPYKHKRAFLENALEEITSLYTIVPLIEMAKKNRSTYYQE